MRKQLLLGAIVAAFGINAASACAILAWNGTNTATAAMSGQPNTAVPAGEPAFARYSALCSLRIGQQTGALAAASYVEDTNVAGATTYKARFYLNTGTANTGAAGYVYLARSAAPADLIRIALNGTNLEATVAGSAAAIAAVPVVAGRYYAVELEWANGTAQPFVMRVTGNGTGVTETRNATVTQTAALGTVRLGLSAGSTGFAQFDEYDSRRTTNPGRLCRGDSNGNNLIQGSDRTAVSNEIIGTLASGQPDCNENTAVQGSDRTCISNLIAAAATCN